MEDSARNILKNISLEATGYKCFGKEGPAIEKILPMNIIIGRNNSGKSSILDLIEYIITPYMNIRPLTLDNSLNYRSGQAASVTLKDRITNEDTHSVPAAEKPFFIDKEIKWTLFPHDEMPVNAQTSGERFNSMTIGASTRGPIKAVDEIAFSRTKAIKSLKYKRLLADRDIVPEKEKTYEQKQSGQDVLQGNGDNATYILQSFLNDKTRFDLQLIRSVLKAMNDIFQPDSVFTNVSVQRRDDSDDKWEINLWDKYENPIPLSKTGSGIRTVLLVLILIHIIPRLENYPLQKFVFCFEELENNLHPAVLRRLFNYLRDRALQDECVFFITTHSNVVIDLFSRDDQAQIIHVTHDGEKATAKTVTTYVEHKGILDDLDVRASDLLQANCVVWMEGPTDRLYFNRWMDLWSDGKLKEGIHYQCVFYGGRLRAHLSAQSPGTESDNDYVEILRVNHNAIMLIDSDKKKESDNIDKTKQRLVSEIKSMDGIAWVTEGREIENYISSRTLSAFYSRNDIKGTSMPVYEKIWEKVDEIKPGDGEKYGEDKVFFAGEIIPYINKEDLNILDLTKQLENIGAKIYQWNGIKV
jgi:predicted ATP-binding protein involved in virulence